MLVLKPSGRVGESCVRVFQPLSRHVIHILGSAIDAFLIGLLLVAVIVAAGTWIEHRWPARATRMPSLTLNMAYFAPASLVQGLLKPAPMVLTASLVNALGGGWIDLPSHGWGLIAGVAVYLVVMDFSEYIFHRAQHYFPGLWAMHSLHHSDESFSVSTTIRHYWLESALKTLSIYLIVAILFKTDRQILMLYGLLSYYNFFVHLNVRIGFGRWAMMLNSPQYHRMHHSARAEHHDRNFAALLPIFDLIFGTYHPPAHDEYPETGLGTGGEVPPDLIDALMWPVRGALQTIRHSRV